MDRRYAMAQAGPAVAFDPAAPEPDVIGLGNIWRPETWLTTAAFLGMLFSPQILSKGPICMLIAAGLLVVRHPSNLFNALKAHWRLMIFPVFCLATVIWSQDQSSTFRAGAEL